MLEKSFEILGKFIKRNAIKFIILWVIIAIILLPFSTLIFSETSYNIASSVVTSNSMSTKASNILQEEFPSQNTTSNSTVDLVLIENANVSNKNVIKTVIEMQNAVLNNATLKKYNVSVSDVYSVESQLLLNFSKNTKMLFNSTYSFNNETKFLVVTLVKIGNYSILYMNGLILLYNNVRSSYIELLNNTNNSLSIEFGIPEYFSQVFLYAMGNGYSINISDNIAYEKTLSFIEGNFTPLKDILVSYLQNFTYFWDYAMINPSFYQNVEEYSIKMALYNSSFSSSFSNNEMVSFWKVLGNYFNVTDWQNFSLVKNFAINYMGNELLQNSTVMGMLPLGVSNFMESISKGGNASQLAINYASYIMNDSERAFLFSFFPNNYFSIIFNKNASFIENYTIENVALKYSSNSSIEKFANALYENVNNLVKFAYKSKDLVNLSANEIAKSFTHNFYGNPLISLNTIDLNSYIISLNGTNNMNEFVNETIINGSFSTYPIVPSAYIFHQFVSYVGNVSLFIVSVNQSAPISTLNIVGNISNEYIPQIKNASYLLAGEKAIEVQLTNESNGGLYRALFVGIIVSIIISLIFFRSPIAGLMPLLIFGLSALISLGINGLLYQYILHSQVSFITPTLLLILLLGLTTDYSVYIISRFRRELRNGNKERGEVTIQWAGHAVFTSGLTVVISYLTLWLANVPLFSDSGLTNAISIAITVFLALTFLPSLLTLLDKKIFWPSKVENVPRQEKIMEKVSKFDKKNRKVLIVIFIVITLFSFYVYEATPSGMDVFQLVPHQSGLEAVQVINQTFKGDTVFQNYIILIFPGKVISNGTYNQSALNVINNTENYLLSTGNISFVYGPTYPFGSYVNPFSINQYSNATKNIYASKINSYIGIDNKTVVIYFQLSMLSWSDKAMNFINFIDAKINSVLSSGVQWYLGGLTQGLLDANNHTVSAFDFIVPIIAVAALIVLLVQFNSVLTPIRLVLMVLGSVLFSLVITYTIFYYIFKMPIIIFLPLFVFITLLAVGLDYDIFMITRVREEVIKGKSDEDGIETSLKENGMVISVLGLILVSTFLSLYLSNIGIIQEMGVGLALGVLIDTFISWMFFIPAVMLVLKSYNWWPSKIGKK